MNHRLHHSFIVPNIVLYELGWISCFLAWYKDVCFYLLFGPFSFCMNWDGLIELGWIQCIVFSYMLCYPLFCPINLRTMLCLV
jgi:hypothetical protein